MIAPNLKTKVSEKILIKTTTNSCLNLCNKLIQNAWTYLHLFKARVFKFISMVFILPLFIAFFLFSCFFIHMTFKWWYIDGSTSSRPPYISCNLITSSTSMISLTCDISSIWYGTSTSTSLEFIWPLGLVIIATHQPHMSVRNGWHNTLFIQYVQLYKDQIKHIFLYIILKYHNWWNIKSCMLNFKTKVVRQSSFSRQSCLNNLFKFYV